MEAPFWIQSWEKGGFHTSFHRKDIHPYVLEHLSPAELQGKTVLVPLCGKSLDMLYLSSYAEKVIGIELVEQAILEFLEENQLSYTHPAPEIYQIGNITLLCRDFMTLTLDDIGRIDWVYDRAALVALPDEMRPQYLQTIDRLTDVHTKSLLITLEYFPLLESAPFSIPPKMVERYYRTSHFISHVQKPLLMEHGMVRRWKLQYLYEHGFILTKHTNELLQTVTAALQEGVLA